jgi:hypothetical protein
VIDYISPVEDRDLHWAADTFPQESSGQTGKRSAVEGTREILEDSRGLFAGFGTKQRG